MTQFPASIAQSVSSYVREATDRFDRFWMSPSDPTLLGLIRLLSGLIVLYTHAVWTLELEAFLGADGLLPPGYRDALGAGYAWSHLDAFPGGTPLAWVHGAALVILAAYAAGWQTRWTSWLAAAITISYANRTLGAGFGLDQVNAMLCLYCAIGRSGAAFSVDRWLADRRDPASQGPQPDVASNLALRLIQVHLCVIYFFAGIGKLQGETWWTGEAVWLALASYEYQTLDMTWLADWPVVVSLITLVSLFWELGYAALIWPRLSRPWMLAIAVLVHLGIGLCLGMLTFGMAMLVANLAFWPCPGAPGIPQRG